MTSTAPAQLRLRVVEARSLNPLIRLLRLRADDGAALPGYTAGAHLRVRVTNAAGIEDWRHYSLVNVSTAPGATEAPREYVIAVRLEAGGRGGSRHMHERVAEGDWLTVEAPKNDFPLGEDAGCRVLVAGGIGVTPLASMAAHSRAEGRPVRMVYAGRERGQMALLAELQALLGADLALHVDAEAGAPLDVAALLDGCAPEDRLYVCGPAPMLDAVRTAARARGWPDERVRFELFAPPPAEAGDAPFELVLAQSGRSLAVPADKSILDCLIDAGCDPMFDCRRGECGVCATDVVEGEPDHRDHVLSESEKASGKVIHICVSRCKGPRLVLDL